MHYELVSRALAYVSCLSTMSLFATTMAIAAVGVGKPQPQFASTHPPSALSRASLDDRRLGGLTDKVHIEAVAAVLWSKKI
jgi:hypothetical protein